MLTTRHWIDLVIPIRTRYPHQRILTTSRFAYPLGGLVTKALPSTFAAFVGRSIPESRSYGWHLFLYIITVAVCVGFAVWTAIPQLIAAAVVILSLTAASVVHWKPSFQLVAGLAGIGAFAFGSAFVRPPPPALYWAAIVTAVALAELIAVMNARRDHNIGAENARLKALAESRERDLLSIAHDLRNPIAFISGIIDLLDHSGITSQESDFALARLGIAVRSMDLLVSNIIDLGSVRDGRLAPRPRVANLAPLITETVRQNSPLAISRKIAFDVDVADSHRVLCDVLHLERILRNLIAAATERSPEGGKVRVVSTAVGNRVCVKITDSGPARDLEMLARVADNAQKPDREARGPELGLFVATRLAEANRSHIELTWGSTGGLTTSLDMPDGSHSN